MFLNDFLELVVGHERLFNNWVDFTGAWEWT